MERVQPQRRSESRAEASGCSVAGGGTSARPGLDGRGATSRSVAPCVPVANLAMAMSKLTVGHGGGKGKQPPHQKAEKKAADTEPDWKEKREKARESNLKEKKEKVKKVKGVGGRKKKKQEKKTMEMEKEKGGAKETGRGTPAVNGHISKTKKKTTKKKTTSRSAKDGPTDCPLCSVETKSLRSITMHLASSKHLSRVRAALGLSAPAPVPALVPVSAPAAAPAPNYSYAAHTTAYPSSINLYAYPSPLPLSKAPFLRTSLPPMARPRARQTQADRISAGLAKLFALRGSKKLHTTQLGYNNIKAVISDVSCSTT